MNDTITVRGIVATAPRHIVTETGLHITSMRLASPSRRWDRESGGWVNGDTNWFTVTAFRVLGANVHRSVIKGDRVIVTGRLRVRRWERADKSGTSIEIDADSVGHDLVFGQGTWMRVLRSSSDESAAPGERGLVGVNAATGEVHGAAVSDGGGDPGVPDPDIDDEPDADAAAVAAQGAAEDHHVAPEHIEPADNVHALGVGLEAGDRDEVGTRRRERTATAP